MTAEVTPLRIPCKRCGAKVRPVTAKHTNGLCRSCFKQIPKSISNSNDSLPAVFSSHPNGIRNCNFKVAFDCPAEWTELKSASNLFVRHCEACRKDVFLCRDLDAAVTHARQGHCVALPAETGLVPPFAATFVGMLVEPKTPEEKSLQIEYKRTMSIRNAGWLCHKCDKPLRFCECAADPPYEP